MTGATTAFRAVFEMRRQPTRSGQQPIERGLDIQQDAAETVARNSLAVGRTVQRQGVELAREATDARVEMFRSAFGGADVGGPSTVDAQFEAAADAQADARDELESGVRAAPEDLSEQQRAVVVESFEAYLDVHRDVERRTVAGPRQAEEAAPDDAARDRGSGPQRRRERRGGRGGGRPRGRWASDVRGFESIRRGEPHGKALYPPPVAPGVELLGRSSSTRREPACRPT